MRCLSGVGVGAGVSGKAWLALGVVGIWIGLAGDTKGGNMVWDPRTELWTLGGQSGWRAEPAGRREGNQRSAPLPAVTLLGEGWGTK